jgi:hypothetical protein
MTKIDHKIHKLVRIQDLPNVEYQHWGEGETIEKFIEYFTHLKTAADAAGAVITRIRINAHSCDGYYKDIEAWIPKTSEEIEEERIAQERIDSSIRERELKELKRLKEKYDGITYALSSL